MLLLILVLFLLFGCYGYNRWGGGGLLGTILLLLVLLWLFGGYFGSAPYFHRW